MKKCVIPCCNKKAPRIPGQGRYAEQSNINRKCGLCLDFIIVAAACQMKGAFPLNQSNKHSVIDDKTTISSKALLAAMRISALPEVSKNTVLTEVNLLIDEANAPKESKADQRIEASRVLADEIYPLLRDARLAKYTAGVLDEGYFEDEADGSTEWREALAINYERAQMQMNILLDYVCRITDSLIELDALATSKAPSSSRLGDKNCVTEQ